MIFRVGKTIRKDIYHRESTCSVNSSKSAVSFLVLYSIRDSHPQFMRKSSTLLFLASLFLCTSGLFAQGDKSQVLLRNGAVSPSENTQQFISTTPFESELIQGKYYRLLQFYEVLSPESMSRLASEGVDLVAYFPYNTWLAAIPHTLDRQLLVSFGLRSAFTAPTEAKIHDWLRDQNYPDYVWEGDLLKVIIQTPENLAPRYVSSLFRAEGIQVGELLDGNQFFALIDPTEVEAIAALPFVLWIEGMPDPGEPEDFNALGLHRSGVLATDNPMGRQYNGAGVNVQVRDDGGIGPHIDFEGRANQTSTGGPGGGTHADGVAGVMGGAGNLNPVYRGAAWGSFFYVTNYQSTFTDNTLSLHQVNGVMITNSSYSNGCNAGYTTTTQRVDNQTYSNPSLLHMFSAGNSNNNNCGYGAGSQWGNITGGHKQGKNVMAVANLFADGSLVASSSRGPAHDGRIKPDIAAHGQGQISIDPFNSYQSFGGTSAAAPSTAGVLAQLYHAYKELGDGSNPPSALIKAIAMNSADDYGNRGPDFKFGWGRINGLKAVKILEEDRYLDSTVAAGGINTHSIEVPPGVRAMKIMTYWSDPAAAPGAGIALVNDLDAILADPTGTTHLPWVLNEAPNGITLDVPAQKGQDHLNNVEQIQVDNPIAGTYTLAVSGFSIPQGPQEYYVIIEFLTEEVEVTHPVGGEGFNPGEQARIFWDAYGDFGPFTIHYSTDNGASWKLAASGIAGANRFYDWSVPSEITGEAKVRVSRGNVVGESPHPFSIVGVPTGLEIIQLCNNQMTLKWDPVPGAVGYDAMILGTQYMDSVGSTDATSFTFDIASPFVANWVSVRAKTADDTYGRRAVAISNPLGPITCTQGDDLRVRAIPSIAGGLIPSCADTVRFSVEVINGGTTPQSNFTVGYQVTGQPAAIRTITDTLQPNEIALYTFEGGYAPTFGLATNIPVKGFVGGIPDILPSNDTLFETLTVTASQLINPPFSEAFEGFSSCPTNSNCGSTICPLGGGWVNETNGLVDDIDWRVNNGTTPSNGTGPSVDHTPGTSAGNYVYLEASNGCENQTAILTSPCIFLAQIQEPRISAWYHMLGGDMGELHVDVFDGEQWREDVAIVSGDQGDEWRELIVDPGELTGSFFVFRLRGITGLGWTSDMALDNISVFDAANPPVAEFSATRQEVCPGDQVTLVDESEFNPTSYEWSFSPSTVTYQGGTNNNSASPILAFGNIGQYDITLKVSNNFGIDSLTRTIYVTASNGMVPPIVEQFDSFTFPPANWSVENPDGDLTWEYGSTTGSDGNITGVARMNIYQYTSKGEEDMLASMNVDLRSAISPYLAFERAYTSKSADYFDELRILVSDNCGSSFMIPVYQKSQLELVTTGYASGPYFPTSAAQWFSDTVDLSQFVGQTISVGFVTMNGNGNNLFLDNINIKDAVTINPQAYAIGNLEQICVGETLSLSDSSAGNNLVYQWDLGVDSNPGLRAFGGTFDVSYDSPGLKTIILTVSNQGGSSSDTLQVMVKPLPEADFTFDIDGGFQTYTFDNLSSAANSYAWDFGDGAISTDSIPTHTYTQNGTYTITLSVTGDCGTDIKTAELVIDNVSIEGMLGGLRLRAYPNPADDRVMIEAEGEDPMDLILSLTDLRGKIIQSDAWSIRPGTVSRTVDVSALAEGVYILQISGSEGQFIRRIVVR